MHLKLLTLALSFLALSAHPLRRNTRDADWTNSKSNQAHDKTDLKKRLDNLYKSHLDSSGLYGGGDDGTKNPMAVELQQKLTMESERLRTLLRQDLAELQGRLFPSPDRRGPTLARMREHLAPLTQQLQSSLSTNSQELCVQLGLFLQGMETADNRPTQALERSSSKAADLISDFHTKALRALEQSTEVRASEEDSELLQLIRSRLGQEVSSLRQEAQSGVGAIKEELAALQEAAVPLDTEASTRVEQLCQSADSLSQVVLDRMEKLFKGLEEEFYTQRDSSLSPSSSSSAQPVGSLQEEFTVKLSALIQDILHSVQ